MDKAKTTNTHKICRTSRVFISLLQFLLVAVPLIDCALWIFMNDLLTPIQHELLPEYVRFPLPPRARFLGWCVSLLPTALFLIAAITLIRLFRLYEKGQIFSGGNVRCFYLLSRILMGWCAVSIIVDPLQSIALTLHHPQGQRILNFGLSSVDLTILFISGVFAVISWVMEEARQIKKEQELTI